MSSAFVYGFSDDGSCDTGVSIDGDSLPFPLPVITANTYAVTVAGSSPMSYPSVEVFKRGNGMYVNGNLVYNGSVITIGGTQVTIFIYPYCQPYPG
jgi:hypothetical protein